jgi:hypothetical protein
MVRRWGFTFLAASVLVFPAAAEAAFPGANGKIAFVRDGDIRTMNPDGSGQTDITSTPSVNEKRPA